MASDEVKGTGDQKECRLCETMNPADEKFCIKCSADLSGVMSFVSPPTVGGPKKGVATSAPPPLGGVKKPKIPGKE